MAVTWQWDTVIGYVEGENPDGRTWKCLCYGGGNCPLVALSEWKEEGDAEDEVHYTLHNFVGDRQHLVNCLKDGVGWFDYKNIVFYSDVMNAKDLKMFCDLFIKYGVTFTVTKLNG